MAAAQQPFRPSDPALCGSICCVLCLLSDYCMFDLSVYYMYLSVFFCYWCTVCVPLVLWYCWLGLLTCKNRLPYNLYCVSGDVKHCSIQSNPPANVCACFTARTYCFPLAEWLAYWCRQRSVTADRNVLWQWKTEWVSHIQFEHIRRYDGGFIHCRCKDKVRAQKRFTLHKLPNVLTIQLKR